MAVMSSAPRRRILLLTPRWPYPIVGGDAVRIWHLAEAVSRHHDITLLCLCQSEAEMQAPVPADGVFKGIHRVLLPRWKSQLQALMALARREPLQLAYYKSQPLARQIAALAHTHDALWCHLIRTAPYALTTPLPRCLELTDAISMSMARVAGSGLPPWSPKRWLYLQEARRLLPVERELSTQFGLCSLIAEPDRAHLFGAAEASKPPTVVVAPNGVDLPAVQPPAAGLRGPEIAFVGQMRSLPNQDALSFLMREVMPLVRERVPAARLHVIGPTPRAVRHRWERHPGILFHGVVGSLNDVLGQCRVGVCPVRIGAGMQNKLLDYLAHGLAAVTSPIGLEGLAARPGEDLCVAHDASEWIAQISDLLIREDQATRIGEAGRALVAAHYTWARSLQGFTRAMNDWLEHSMHRTEPRVVLQ